MAKTPRGRLLEGKVFVGRCPICDAIFFACTADVIQDAAEEIANIRREAFTLQWIDNEQVRLHFNICDHIAKAREYREFRGKALIHEPETPGELIDPEWQSFWDRIKEEEIDAVAE